MKLSEITNCTSKKIEHKEIPISKLDSMLDYQRDICMSFVHEKSRDDVFDENELNEVKVSVRSDGSMKVCDGQHTIAILKKRGWTTVPCELRYDLSVQDENDWFSITNTKEQKQAAKRIMTAKINGTYKKNKIEQDFYKGLKELGYKLDIYGEMSGDNYKIKCVSSLFSLFKEYALKEKSNVFFQYMYIVKTCFQGDPISLQWGFLRGVFDFCETYENEFDKQRLISVLSCMSAANIKKEAERDEFVKRVSLKYARFFVYKYNYRLLRNKRLNMDKLIKWA